MELKTEAIQRIWCGQEASGGKTNLYKNLIENGMLLESPCSGNGTCGKCKIRIHSGEVSPLTDIERSKLSKEEIASNIRLACLVEGKGDVCVEWIHTEQDHRILTHGYVSSFSMDHELDGYGILMDLGTTTVVMSLVDRRTGEEIAHDSQLNAQTRFGFDVLTRITYEMEHPDTGKQELQKMIVDSVDEMIIGLCKKTNISPCQIKEMVVSANCTMLHMLLGADARSIGRVPYQPVFLEAQTVLGNEIGLESIPMGEVYCIPSVSAFVGGDIVSGVRACDLRRKNGKLLFIDIGTNGEIVLANEKKLLCCSCAAGPALEGMNIQSGMRAAEGAIENVQMTEAGISLQMIGEGSVAKGICGSGILAAVKELLRIGLIQKSGAILKKEQLSELDFRRSFLKEVGMKRLIQLQKTPEIVVTQSDIRQVQLAKGAILSGILILLKEAGICADELDKVIIAGQFGTHLPRESLIKTGVLPKEVEEKLIYAGNTSKSGAYMALLSRQIREEMEEIASEMQYIELAETEQYDRIFAKCMRFPVD